MKFEKRLDLLQSYIDPWWILSHHVCPPSKKVSLTLNRASNAFLLLLRNLLEKRPIAIGNNRVWCMWTQHMVFEISMNCLTEIKLHFWVIWKVSILKTLDVMWECARTLCTAFDWFLHDRSLHYLRIVANIDITIIYG